MIKSLINNNLQDKINKQRMESASSTYIWLNKILTVPATLTQKEIDLQSILKQTIIILTPELAPLSPDLTI